MVKDRSFWIRLLLFFLPFCLFFTYFAIEVAKSYLEVPILANITLISNIGGAIDDGTLSIKNFFVPYGEHGMFGYNVLLWFNLSCLRGTLFFDMVIYDVVVFATGVFLFVETFRHAQKISYVWYFVFSTAFSFIFCCLAQKSCSGMETQVRLTLLFLIPLSTSYFHLLRKEGATLWKRWVAFSVLTFFTLNVFGTLYSLAIVPFFIFTFVIRSVREKRVSFANWMSLLILLSSVALYFLEYGFLRPGNGNNNAKGLWDLIVSVLSHIPDAILSVFAYFGASLLSYNDVATTAIQAYDIWALALGGITLFFIAIALFVYLKKSLFHISYGPAFFILYSLFVVVEVVIGRLDYGWKWLFSEWYSVHAKYAFIGIIWVFFLALGYRTDSVPLKPTTKTRWQSRLGLKRNAFSAALLVVFSVFGCAQAFAGNIFSSDYWVYTTRYYQEKQGYLLITNPDYMPVDSTGKTPLLVDLASSIDFTNLIKRQGWYIYRDPRLYATDAFECPVVCGCYGPENEGSPSRWISPQAIFPMNCNAGVLDFEFYLPQDNVEGNAVSVFFDDELIQTIDLTTDYNHVSINIGKQRTNGLLRIMVKKPIPPSSDSRTLGIVLITARFD